MISPERDKDLIETANRKIDLRIFPLTFVLHLFCFLDRVNLGNVYQSFQNHIHITHDQFATILGMFFVGYVCFEVPSNLMLKYFKPSKWFTAVVVSWGTFSLGTAWTKSYSTLLILRFCLGIAEAGFFPGLVYYLTLWYAQEQIAFRIGCVISAACAAGAVSGLISFAVLSSMEGIAKTHAYQWLFIIEAVPAIVGGGLVYFILPDSPATAKFLTNDEKQALITYLRHENFQNLNEITASEQIGIGNTDELRDMDTRRKLLLLFKSMHATLSSVALWCFGFGYFCLLTPMYAAAFFLPAMLGEIGFSEIRSNLLSVPVFTLAGVMTVYWAKHSDRKKERALHIGQSSCVAAAGYTALAICGSANNFTASYLSMLVAVMGVFPSLPCSLAWLSSANIFSKRFQQLLSELSDQNELDLVGQTRKSIQTALIISLGNFGGIAAPQVFALSQQHTGSFKIAHICMSCLLFMASVSAFLAHKFRLQRKYSQSTMPNTV